MPFTPQLQLETLFALDSEGRILSTREPRPAPGPAFSLIRDRQSCAWAVHVDVPSDVARRMAALARTELPAGTFTDAPRHAAAYVELLGGRADSGPVFTFPDVLAGEGDVVEITSLSQLDECSRGWTAEEIPERAPIVGVEVEGRVVSVCFCARRSPAAAEAGVETAASYRGRGFAPLVTAAWARRIRQSGRLPLYSTSWSNAASLAVARKLGLTMCGSDWNVHR